MKKERGKYVSRSVYQKTIEENRRLKNDIYVMVMKVLSPDSILIRQKWKDKFEKDAAFAQLMHDYAVQYIKDHPDCVAAKITREYEEETKKKVK